MDNSYLSPEALILVAILPHPDDLQLARVLGWYRIPFCSAPRILNVDYLAFYQPASFKNRRWLVEYLAPVLGHELTTRIELLREQPDHPRADQEYYKIQLGRLQELPRPIQAGGWKRFTFLYTTGSYFRNARILKDLAVAPSERRQLWKALRERGSSPGGYQIEDPDLGRISLELISALLGIEEGDPLSRKT